MTTATNTKLNFSAPVDALLEATSKLLSVVPAKSPKPVLSNILFTIRDGVLELSGTDFTAGIHYLIPAAVIKDEGTGLLNGARFAELLKEFRGATAQLIFNPRGGCSFKAKGGRYRVTGDDTRDYPKTRRFEDKAGFAITGADLVEMVKKTRFSAKAEESRLTIHGVLFELKGGRFRMVATDNNRMSITEKRVERSEDFSVSVPSSFLTALLKVTTKDVAGKPAVLGVTGTKIFFRLPGATVYSTVLQGNYPPYEEALGITLAHYIDCDVRDLLSTLRRSMLVNDRLAAFNFSYDLLSLDGMSSSVGTGTADMPTTFAPPEGVEKIRAGYNPKYYKDALEVMTSKRCRFLFEGPRKAGILKELVTVTGADGTREDVSDDFIYAVMPALLPREN